MDLSPGTTTTTTAATTGAVSSTLLTPGDAPAGIHCANPDCRTRAGERSRGHQSCRALLCGHCCQSAAKAAAEAGEQRPVCKVHARRTHTGHRPLPKDHIPQQTHHQNHQSQSQSQHHHHQQQQQQSHHAQQLHHQQSQPQIIQHTQPQQHTLQIESSAVFEHAPEFQDMLEKRARLEQSLKRSLTLVIWYRNGCEPLRIAHEVTTFPFFQLQDFPELVNELGLQSSSYIDVYNCETGLWEQHKISTVRTVEQDQRLLYKLRPSLLDGLTDCPSLDQELQLQPNPLVAQLKRQIETPPPSGGKLPRVIPSELNPVRVPSTASPIAAQIRTPPPPSTSTSASPANWNFSRTSASPSSAATTIAAPRASTHSPAARVDNGIGGIGGGGGGSSGIGTGVNGGGAGADGARRWPTDYTVHAIAEGFERMATLVRGSEDARSGSGGGGGSAGTIRQKAAFEQVFAPCRYVKSTVGRAKLYWKRASPEMRAHFLGLSSEDPRARWSQFVHMMDGRLVVDLGKEKGVVGVGGVGGGGGGGGSVGGGGSMGSGSVGSGGVGVGVGEGSGVGMGVNVGGMGMKEDEGEEEEERQRQRLPPPPQQQQHNQAPPQAHTPIVHGYATPQQTSLPPLSIPLSRQHTMPTPVVQSRGGPGPGPGPGPGQLQGHTTAPLLSLPPSYAGTSRPRPLHEIDRTMQMSRSSNSLAGAMTIPSQ